MKIIKPKVIIFDWNGTLAYNDKDNLMYLMPNASKVIKKMNELEIQASIISNTYVAFLNRIVKKYGLSKYFLNIIGTRGGVEYRKPSKEVVEYALIGADIDDINRDSVWMVGNSMQDIQTAYNANIRPVIFGYELLNRVLMYEGLAKNKGALFFQNFGEILKFLKGFEDENS